MASDELAVAKFSLGRACEIEAGRGAPPTKEELAQIAALKERVAPVLRKVFPPEQQAQVRRAMSIYRRMSRLEQQRWGDRTPAQLLLQYERSRAPRRAATTSRARPRARRATARAGAPRGDPDPEPEPDLAGLRGWEAASFRMVQHERRRAKAAIA